MRWFISILALWFVVAPTGATATETRSCSGTLAAGTSIAKINGEGTCKNKAHANDCRANARNAIVACAKALYADRGSDAKLPAACLGGRGAKTAVLQWNQVILGIRGDNIADRVRWNECCRTQNNSNADKSVEVKLTVVGDKGCGGTKTGSKTYRSSVDVGPIFFNCQKQRQKGLCGG
jgi:hypothetical protein